ncbi:TRAP transporter small permease subunit [Mangrovitalea sediminis]|uniref:TRAP transporter small permease subunit n=1 Tax=Mangrovitalea sediminis TaxID=1982043 RepID=UPI000BE52A70|nr:TRAP transporter small permease subunit [Mangrovitalea sediminis]
MPHLLKLAGGIDWLNQKLGQLMQWLALLMVLIGVYNASARYLGNLIGRNLSSNAYLELQWYLFGAIFMLGASYTLRHDAHVRVDILYSRLSTKGKAWIDLLGTLLFLLPFCILVLWLSWDWVAFSWKIHEMSSDPSGLARYPIKTVVPVAFAMLILQGISQLIKAVGVITGHLESMTPDKTDSMEGL